MTDIYFVTSNNYKFRKFSESLSTTQFNFIQLNETTPEIQSTNNSDVAEFSAKWASQTFNKPVICEDVGLYIDALHGFPGPYLSHIEKWIETDGFLNLMSGVGNREAHWEYCVAFCVPGSKPVSFSTFPRGSIAYTAKGKDGWYADKIFLPENEKLTIAEMLDLKIYKRNKDHYEKLLEYLKKEYQFS